MALHSTVKPLTLPSPEAEQALPHAEHVPQHRSVPLPGRVESGWAGVVVLRFCDGRLRGCLKTSGLGWVAVEGAWVIDTVGC